MSISTAALDKIASRNLARSKAKHPSLAISHPPSGTEWRYGEVSKPYFIASITKLFTSALVMRLVVAGELRLDDPAADYLPTGTMAGLHVWRDVDAAGSITVRQLLGHTSGLADYFEQKRVRGSSIIEEVTQPGSDRAWDFAHVQEVLRSSDLKPRFAPGTRGKAFYSDSNYTLLGQIMEHVTGNSYADNVARHIIEPLGLKETWLFTPDTVARYEEITPIHLGDAPLHIPLAMASMGPDGGAVSTVTEQITFLKAFLTGQLFPVELLNEMTREFHTVFFPISAGAGIQRFAAPRIMTLGRRLPTLLGHGGASGTVLFHAPEADLWVAGSVNQLQNRPQVYQLMMRLLMRAA